MKTKRIVSAMLVLTIAVSLAGCSGKQTETPSGKGDVTPAATEAPAPTVTPAPTATPVPTDTPTPTVTPTPAPSVDPATEEFVLENADGKTAADLADNWTIRKYADNWVECGASIGVAESYIDEKGNCFTINCWNNYTAFRYTYEYKADKGFNAIEFDAKGDGIANVKIQLMSGTDGVYATYDLGKISDKWNHYVVSLTDSKWKVQFGGGEYSLGDVLANMGMSEYFELIPYFDMFNMIFQGATDNGANAHLYFDDLKFTYDKTAVTSVTDLNLADKLVMNFDKVNGWGEAYPSKEWLRSKYVGNGWQSFETGINDYNSSKAGSKLLGLTTGWSTNFMYKYIGDGNGLGSFDHFSVDLGTYNSTKNMKVKLVVVTENGENIYLMGSADSMTELKPDPTMQNFTFDFGKRTAVKEFYFCVYSADQNGDHLFIDNIKLY